jgi:hypothetical protein
MANEITVTAANVRALTENGAILQRYIAGAAITIGNLVYIASDGDVEHADGNVSLAVGMAIGIAVASYDGETSVAAGDPVSVCVFGPVSGYASMTPGTNLYVSDTVGRLSSVAGTVSRVIGYARSADVVFVHPQQNVTSS